MSTLFLTPLWADNFYGILDGITRVLAVVGGAACGAFLLGYVGRILTSLFTGRQVPTWGRRVFQLCGAVLFGVLAAYWVYGGGGGSIGGPGGSGMGGGDKPRQQTDQNKTPDKTNPPRTVAPIQVEVLGNLPLGAEEVYYLVQTEKMYTLADLQSEILLLREKEPERPVSIILYQDSPAEDKQQVSALQEWLHRELMKKPPEVLKKSTDAPKRAAPPKT